MSDAKVTFGEVCEQLEDMVETELNGAETVGVLSVLVDSVGGLAVVGIGGEDKYDQTVYVLSAAIMYILKGMALAFGDEENESIKDFVVSAVDFAKESGQHGPAVEAPEFSIDLEVFDSDVKH